MRSRISVFQRTVGLTVVLAVVPLNIAQADFVYGANAAGRQLVSFDTETLEASIVGQIGAGGVAGLTIDRAGVLFGLDVGNPDRLITIDPVTGAGTDVGPTGIDGDLGAGLANDPVTDSLFAVTGQVGAKSLIAISKDTGAATVIGPVQRSVVGLSFDRLGELWAIDGLRDELIRIDPSTGDFDTIGGSLPSAIASLGIGQSGVLWAVDSSGSTYRLFSIDPTTGSATLHGTLNGIPWAGPKIGLASIMGASDSDGDGVPDGADVCPDSDLDVTIVIDDCETGVPNQPLGYGCFMSDLIRKCAEMSRNHEAFVRCVSREARVWKQGGLISGRQKGSIQSCAAGADLP